MNLVVATEADIGRLMSWFPTERSVKVWGGPEFRYPYTPETFREDARWQQIDTYSLVDSGEEMLAFGQLYERHRRINLARLAVTPERRGQGIGKPLLALLMAKGRVDFPLTEFSLFVYKDNYPAQACYRSMGFSRQEYPDDDEMADSCIYMTRPVGDD